MKAISNVFENGLGNKYAPPIRQNKEAISLDYLYSDVLTEIEDGIAETMAGINQANLCVALAFAKIDREALYIQAGCKSYLEYLDTAEDRLSMSRQTMSDYKRIGEIYLTFKSQLQNAGFREEGHLHKLRYLPRALEHHPEKEVFERIVKDPLRKFVKYATVPLGSKGDEGTATSDGPPDPAIEFDGQGTLQFTEELNELSKAELLGYVRKIYDIIARGNTPYILDLYDESESKAVERFIKQRRMNR